jgi:hypothetical protein
VLDGSPYDNRQHFRSAVTKQPILDRVCQSLPLILEFFVLVLLSNHFLELSILFLFSLKVPLELAINLVAFVDQFPSCFDACMIVFHLDSASNDRAAQPCALPHISAFHHFSSSSSSANGDFCNSYRFLELHLLELLEVPFSHPPHV